MRVAKILKKNKKAAVVFYAVIKGHKMTVEANEKTDIIEEQKMQ